MYSPPFSPSPLYSLTDPAMMNYGCAAVVP
jgi:hypothetical protein